MSSILTNNSSMVALQTLKSINKSMTQVQNEISTGKSVATAKDNAAVWAISKVMESDVKGFAGISDSLSLGSSTLSVARQASESVTDLLTEIKGKIVAAQEGNVDREKIQADISELRDQIKTVTGAAQFNGLNMVKGTDDVSILSSLDRSNDGSVTASQITVNRMDLSSDAGKFGADSVAASAYGTSTDAAGTTVAVTTDKDGKAAETTFAGPGGAGEAYQMTVGGAQLNYTSITGDTADTVAAHFASAINALGLEGVTADATAAALSISNTNPFESVEVVGNTANTGTMTYNGLASSATNSNVEQRAETIDFSLTASVVEGDSFKVTVGSQSFDYIAGKGETMEDVAKGLKTAIDSNPPTGVTAQVQKNAETGQWSLAVDSAESDGAEALTLSVAQNGTASGGLFGLDNLDVTTNEGAASALTNIETMINSAIDAAAAFGSAQSRIDIQSDFVSKLSDAMESGIGSMVDADMEETSARLQALQVQQQLGVQALSIANQSPQSILSLFQ
ncbi:flagellin N-terminal helical domain-containing protein [Pseudorhodobacter aquimaris]|uniref:flagellin N-terminal helical domain-containing protein n=1 Tax=Pseudorhodobacter aquimaris TaxID=687412 RepID=UPI00067DF8E5|nr:flagellin [Pseudorhodobacter aquimaris]